MKENYIPTGDLKIGVKVVGKVFSGVFEELKPAIQYEAQKKLVAAHRLFVGSRI